MLSFILSFKSLSFISIVWSSGQTNLSRKRSFSKMLLKEKTLKTRLCAILRLKENILKTEPKTRQYRPKNRSTSFYSDFLRNYPSLKKQAVSLGHHSKQGAITRHGNYPPGPIAVFFWSGRASYKQFY